MNSRLSRSECASVFAYFNPGFQPGSNGRWRGPATYRGGNNPNALSIDLDRGWYDHVLGEGGDCIGFAMRCMDADFVRACKLIEDIIGRDLLDCDRDCEPRRPLYTEQELVDAELFR